MTAPFALRALRRAAVDRRLGPPTDLPTALDRLGFVQADPIRAPARAQDLILRQRVAGYRAGDLERAYPSLPLFEDMVHVYGFVHRKHRALLHPRRIARTFDVEQSHPHLRRAILDHLKLAGPSHPREIDAALASRWTRASIVNAWGGQSNATTRMLDILQYRGLLDVVRRERGIRIHALRGADRQATTRSPRQRAEGLIELLVDLYAPLPVASLMQLTVMLGERTIPRDDLRARVPVLLRRGRLQRTRVEGTDYLWPAADESSLTSMDHQPRVLFLAPFDPLVWDRRRFMLLWGWTYRFEAYTPLAKRKLGYYALPVLWDRGDDAVVIGWVNVTRPDRRHVIVKAGYEGTRPAGVAYRTAFDEEVARLECFLADDQSSDLNDP